MTSKRIWLKIEGERVGYYRLRRSKYAGEVVYWVRPELRGRGYGKRILRLAVKRARGKLRVVCRESNIASRKVIEANGGKLVGTIKLKGKENRLVFELA